MTAPAEKHRAAFPHCDQRVLHAPGECEFCDQYSDWQALRSAWGICFTGKPESGKLPCPAEMARPLATINRWGGNTPHVQTVVRAGAIVGTTSPIRSFEPKVSK